MKKFNLLFLSAIALVSVTSCSKKEDDDKSASIVGKWEFTKARGVGTDGTDSGEIAYPNGFSKSTLQCGTGDILNFTTATDAAYVDSYLTDATDANSCTTQSRPFTYTFNGKNLTINGLSDQSETFNIVSLTKDELRISVTSSTETDTFILVKK